jgi:heme/copper-type cytochrome/quinol oxidase subunit 2
MRKLAAVIATAIVLSAIALSSPLPPAGSQSQATHVIEVSAKKYEFTPNELHVKQGDAVELRVHSEDEAHGVKLDIYAEGVKDKNAPGLLFAEPDTNGKVTKGVDQVLRFTAQQAGVFDFKCARICGMGHGRMKGKLIVDPQ